MIITAASRVSTRRIGAYTIRFRRDSSRENDDRARLQESLSAPLLTSRVDPILVNQNILASTVIALCEYVE